MKAVVLYESVYGNTEAIARAIADGLASNSEVTLARFGEVPQGAVEAADLVILGGPTHGWGMTRPASRKQPGTEGYPVGAREWLERARPAGGKMAAAFDTRFPKPRWLTGSAAVRIARRLRGKGYRLVAPPQSFFVLHSEGPLRDGEEDRARAWGAELARGPIR
ncbi:MAG TPA: flavodoxin domain-containing protein [Actinomycetota bacterium]|nr:flavodoxin domain-containing protein [Actinomycetota bacterium]